MFCVFVATVFFLFHQVRDLLCPLALSSSAVIDAISCRAVGGGGVDCFCSYAFEITAPLPGRKLSVSLAPFAVQGVRGDNQREPIYYCKKSSYTISK